MPLESIIYYPTFESFSVINEFTCQSERVARYDFRIAFVNMNSPMAC